MAAGNLSGKGISWQKLRLKSFTFPRADCDIFNSFLTKTQKK